MTRGGPGPIRAPAPQDKGADGQGDQERPESSVAGGDAGDALRGQYEVGVLGYAPAGDHQRHGGRRRPIRSISAKRVTASSTNAVPAGRIASTRRIGLEASTP